MSTRNLANRELTTAKTDAVDRCLPRAVVRPCRAGHGEGNRLSPACAPTDEYLRRGGREKRHHPVAEEGRRQGDGADTLPEMYLRRAGGEKCHHPVVEEGRRQGDGDLPERRFDLAGEVDAVFCKIKNIHLEEMNVFWWGKVDSNHRSH